MPFPPYPPYPGYPCYPTPPGYAGRPERVFKKHSRQTSPEPAVNMENEILDASWDFKTKKSEKSMDNKVESGVKLKLNEKEKSPDPDFEKF